ncbi:MAG: insulinase family protein [Holosporales bacterium]|jgi:zinc protease|nr:insulinase family protein [Holosporales bacterium]
MKTLSVVLCCMSAVVFCNLEGAEKLSKGTKLMLERNKKDAAKKKKPLLNAQTKVLKNGLHVVVVEDHQVPRVSVGVLYHVGSCDDPENLLGISHMLEHMFFHGSKKYPNVSETISTLGGSTNAFTSEDCTMYIEDCPSDAVDVVLLLEADRMANFFLHDDVVFQKERKAVFEERLMRVENPPLGIANEYITNALSPQHPYGREIIGMRHHILAYSREAVMEHYRKWYGPNNATLVVIGDVNAAEIFKKAENAFGGIKARPAVRRERVQNAITEGIQHTVQYCTDKVESEKVSLFYQAPHHKADGLDTCYALCIGLDALFEGVVCKFCRHFVDKKGLVFGMDCSYDVESWDPKPVVIQVSLVPGVQYKKFSQEFEKEIQKVVAHGLDPREFDRAKKSCITDMVHLATDGHQKIRMMLACLALGLSIDDIEKTHDRLEAVTLEQTNAVLKRVFAKEPVAIVRLCPEATAK